MAAVTVSSDFRAQENTVCHCFHCFSVYLQLSKPVHSEGDQPWDFFGRTDAEAEAPHLGHLMTFPADSLEKTLILGKIEGGRRRG